jgi:5-methylthioadenosine/S-adenosylhomocysteine deaminase
MEHAQVEIEGDRILYVGSRRHTPLPTLDLGNAVLLPGLVNAHTHLEYTLFRGLLEDIDFFPWIRELTARKASLEDRHWTASATVGAMEVAAAGTTTIADCTDSGAALIGAKRVGLRGVVYQEVFGIDETRSTTEIIDELSLKVKALRWAAAGTSITVGISPHSPYTVRPQLFEALHSMLSSDSMPVCIHAAESQAEAALLRTGTGPIAEMYRRRGIAWTPPGCSTIAYLNRMGLLSPQTLLVHTVQMSAGDRKLLQQTGAALVHCPRSNAKLGNGVAPLHLMREAYADAAPIGLGTDSAASANNLDMWEEMRFTALMQRAHRSRVGCISAAQVLEMGTIGGARALGMAHRIGSLEPGKLADLCAVRLDTLSMHPCYDPVQALIYSASAKDVAMTMVGGRILFGEGAETTGNIAETLADFEDGAARMRRWQPPNQTGLS